MALLSTRVAALAPAAALAEMAEQARRAMDEGRQDARTTRRRLAEAARQLLAQHPRDEALIEGFKLLASLRFTPPAPVDLPAGSPDEVAEVLQAWSDTERLRLVEAVLTAPDPASDVEAACRVLEAWLSHPSAHERAERLAGSLKAHVSTGYQALVQVRLGLAQGRSPESLEALVHAAQAPDAGPSSGDGTRHIATALRMLATAQMAQSWPDDDLPQPVTVLGGRYCLGLPLLKHLWGGEPDESPSRLWEEAERLAPARKAGGLLGMLAAADDADRSRQWSRGTERLVRAIDRAAERPSLVAALAHRGAWLLQPSLIARAQAVTDVQTSLQVVFGDLQELTRRAAVELQTPPFEAPAPPERGWSALVDTMANRAEDPWQDGAWLWAAGARERAVQAWANAPDPDDTPGASPWIWATAHQATLTDKARKALATKLEAWLPEGSLASSETAWLHACCLWSLLDESDPDRALWEIRLRSSWDPPEADAVNPASDAAPNSPDAHDSPHAPANRLASAQDLTDARRDDAAGQIVAALLRRPEGVPHQGLLDVTMALLGREQPPGVVLEATRRALARRDTLAEALVAALQTHPMSAYALHDWLVRAGVDGETPDAWRMRYLAAWLAIWRATNTAPDSQTLRPVMQGAPGLLALAAAQLGGHRDPVKAAQAFTERFPPESSLPREVAAALLEV